MRGAPLTLIGRAEEVALPAFEVPAVVARIDTGAKTSALGVSNVVEKQGVLSFTLFDKKHELYTGKIISTSTYSQRLVSSSTGHVEKRYVIKTVVILHGRKIKASFTLANRASQAYPILVGRNILRGKFLVDVTRGKANYRSEKQRELAKQEKFQQLNPDKDIV